MARSHAAPAVELANPCWGIVLGHDAHGLGDAFTFDEVRDCQRGLKNHKSAGSDGIPVELFKSGGTGVQVLTHPFNAITTTRCVPSVWRQGVVVHVPEGGDTGDCFNSKPLTLLPVVDKLFAKLLSERIARAVCLLDQQYAFRPGRGTLNPLQNLLAVVRQRTLPSKAAYACFFIPQQHMTQYRTLCYSTAPFRSALWVQSLQFWLPHVRAATCILIGVQQGVCWDGPVPCLCGATWGCTRVPTVLADVCNLHRPCIAGNAELVATRQSVGRTTGLTTQLVGQACADNLAGIAPTQQNLQRDVDAVHTHSLRWGWLLNVPKPMVMIFGKRSVYT